MHGSATRGKGEFPLPHPKIGRMICLLASFWREKNLPKTNFLWVICKDTRIIYAREMDKRQSDKIENRGSPTMSVDII